MKLSGLKTKKEVIRQALLEFVNNRNRRDLRELQGKILFDDGYDYKARSNGVTPRSTIDTSIALTVIEHNLTLLHEDRDFDAMAIHLPSLQIFNSI